MHDGKLKKVHHMISFFRNKFDFTEIIYSELIWKNDEFYVRKVNFFKKWN